MTLNGTNFYKKKKKKKKEKKKKLFDLKMSKELEMHSSGGESIPKLWSST